MYKIKLPNFEGPFDLLLYFIKRDELNIYDIPISKITAEFLRYIQLMQHYDIELAGEFVVMAANLMYIKAQMLLPRTNLESDAEPTDPREELVRNILEYKQFKEVAGRLSILADVNKFYLYKSNFEAELAQAHQLAGYRNASLTNLLLAYGTAITRGIARPPVHIVEMFNITIGEKIAEIQERLATTKRLDFAQLVAGQSKTHVIVTFLAVLELIKAGTIDIAQHEPFGEIVIWLRQLN